MVKKTFQNLCRTKSLAIVRFRDDGQISYRALGSKVCKNLASIKDRRRNIPLRFGLNWVSNSRYIPDMDKCCLDKVWSTSDQ